MIDKLNNTFSTDPNFFLLVGLSFTLSSNSVADWKRKTSERDQVQLELVLELRIMLVSLFGTESVFYYE